jgi:hypothetical protein
MNLFSKIVSIAALVFFAFAQVQGWTVERMFSGGGNGNSFARGNYHK